MEGPRDPEQLEAKGAPGGGELSPLTTVGAVHLTVADLDRSVDYYTRSIGLELLDRAGGLAFFGARNTVLLVLVEHPASRGRGHHTGLYHFALLLPERADLARWLAHAARDRVALVGLSDHFVSEALYLSDPDGHGIEIYWDRPRAGWEGQVARMTTLRLDVDDLLGELDDPAAEPFDGLPDGTGMGHIHLKVAAIEPTIAFYRDVIGFELMAQLGGQAAFLSAGATITWGRTPGRAPGARRRRPAPPASCTRRSSSPMPSSGITCSRACPTAGRHRSTPRTDRCSSIRRATGSSSLTLDDDELRALVRAAPGE